MSIDLSDAALLAAIDAFDPAPPVVLDTARAVFAKRPNPFALLAEPDGDDLLAGCPLWPAVEVAS